jgi:aminopeptidase N
MPNSNPAAIYLKDYRPPAFLIDQVTLRFELDDETTKVSSRLAVRRNPLVAVENHELRLDGEHLELLSIALNGVPLSNDRYQLDHSGLMLTEVPAQFILDTEVCIHPLANTALEGLFRSGPMLCTQCEPEGFRHITFFIDRPDVMASFHTTLVGSRDRYPVLLSNGNRIDQRDLGDGRHLAIWDDPFPKPSYLFP